MIEIKDLTKTYGKSSDESYVIALNKVSITIKSGEFVGIIGESGSGKSTLLNMIGALDIPSEGSININGIDVSKFNENEAAKFRLNNIGFVFQNFYLEQDFSVQKNVEIPLILKGIEKEKRQELAKRKLISLGLEAKLSSKINELSGGQRQRVCIARALVNDPKIILADEPTGNLDTKNGMMVINLLKSLTKQGITVVLVTHNMKEAALCDRLICLQDGNVVEMKDEI